MNVDYHRGMITVLLLLTFLGINYCIFSYLMKRTDHITLLDGVVTGLTVSLSGSYLLYVLISGITPQALVLLTPILALEAVLLTGLIFSNIQRSTI